MGPNSPRRIGCVDLPAFPLQLLLEDQPRWQRYPAAVIDDDHAQGTLLWVNECARRLRVLPGMRFSTARTLASQLRAAPVPPARIEDARGEIFARLHNFSPRVESHCDHPGTFWIDPGGLVKLYRSLEQWSAAIASDLATRGFQAYIVIGFHRFRTQAITRTLGNQEHVTARSSPTSAKCPFGVIPSPEIEASAAKKVPLQRLDVSPKLSDELKGLDIITLGDFLDLPAGELCIRFGQEAQNLHNMASAGYQQPLQACVLRDPVITRLEFDPPEDNKDRLIFRIKPMVDTLIDALSRSRSSMAAMRLEIVLDHADTLVENLSPAAPTLDVLQIIDLIRLRLTSLTLVAPVEAIVLQFEGTSATSSQLALFATQQKRDLEAGSQALARLRAAYGSDSVTRAQLRDAHLPEASFYWEPTQILRFPRKNDRDHGPTPLVRCVHFRPRPLTHSPKHKIDSWPPRYHARPLVDIHGPFRISGGWWARLVERDYYFVTQSSGLMVWIYYDRPRQR